MILSPTDCGKNIRTGNYDNLYFLYGRDVGALEPFASKLVDKLCPKDAQVMNLHTFDPSQTDPLELSDASNVLPMFADRVVVLIKDLNLDNAPKNVADMLRKIISDIPETTTLVITAGGEDRYKNRRSLTDKNKRFCDLCAKHGTVCEFSFKSVSDCAKLIIAAVQKQGSDISRQTAEYLAKFCMCETMHINREIPKLCAFVNGGEIQKADIDALCIKKIESDGYGLAINLLTSNALYVFDRLSELKAQNYEPTQILSVINMSLTDIYRARLARSAGLSYTQCAEDFKYPKNREFAVKNAFGECSNISLERIRRCVTLLSDFEFKLKSTSMTKPMQFLAVEEFAAAAMA